MSLQDGNTQPQGCETIWCHFANGRERVVEVPADLVVRTLINESQSDCVERCTYGVSRSYITAKHGAIDVVMYWRCFYLEDPAFAESRRIIDKICDEAAVRARVVCRDHEEYRRRIACLHGGVRS